MPANFKPNTMLTLTIAALLSVGPFAGCAERGDPPPPPDDGEQGQQPGEQGETNQVDVGLTEWEIDTAQTLPPGRTVLQVTNNGNMPHDLAIQGQGLNKQLEPGDAYLEAGQSGTMEIDLQPGEYRVWCPVGNHAGMGMEMTLTVEEQT
ncbi:MAG: plastocyanin/azurin family copper-binding protein [Planctomycetota bacterium]